jgi:hypothetical protein
MRSRRSGYAAAPRRSFGYRTLIMVDPYPPPPGYTYSPERVSPSSPKLPL